METTDARQSQRDGDRRGTSTGRKKLTGLPGGWGTALVLHLPPANSEDGRLAEWVGREADERVTPTAYRNAGRSMPLLSMGWRPPP